MSPSSDFSAVGVEACDCLTPFGSATETHAALLAGRRALQLHPVLGPDGGDPVPLALLGGTMAETSPPRWLGPVRELAARVPSHPWGTHRFPAIVTSSNFGVGSLYAFTRSQEPAHLAHGAPFTCVELLQRELGWGPQIHVFSHACVSAHLGLAHATRLLDSRLAERVLVLSFDFVSPFVAGGFHALKILNAGMPAPFAIRDTGSIGLGDGAAFAVLSLASTSFRIEAQSLFNEMHHFTSNQADGSGFAVGARTMANAARGRRIWIKGHGTGTLDAGRLEAEGFAKLLPAAPLVSWKGSLGHTLGSCGLVELALAMAALKAGRIPGTIGTAGPCFTETVALEPLAADDFDATLVASNAFGGAHAAFLLSHE